MYYKKSTICVALFFIVISHLVGYDFKLDVVSELEVVVSRLNLYDNEEKIFTNGIGRDQKKYFFIINKNGLQVEKKIEKIGSEYVAGMFGNNKLLTRSKKDGHFYFIDYDLNRVGISFEIFRTNIVYAPYMVEYQNGDYFISVTGEFGPFDVLLRINEEENSVEVYGDKDNWEYLVDEYELAYEVTGFVKMPRDGMFRVRYMTNDKLNIVGTRNGSSNLAVYNISENIFSREFRIERNDNVQVLGNNLVINTVNNNSMSKNQIECTLYDINLMKINDVSFQINASQIKDIIGFRFVKDLSTMFVLYKSNTGKHKTLVLDTTPFRDWLLDQGLLFRETTGTITGTPELREYPNLEAEIFGTLELGSEVKVYDQSGIQVTIGENTDWWYEIETAFGEKGWVFGPYIDVDEAVEPDFVP